MLAEVLRLVGFEAVPLRYCDRAGTYIRNDPANMRDTYARCPEQDLVYRTDYIMRLDSLIVDGIRPP
jgi:hypothetical protein